jgi:hypothetical protein
MKSDNSVFQVAMLQSQLQQVMQENGGKAKPTTSQDAARELIADITSTLSVRSSRIMQTSSVKGPTPGQNGSINLATKGGYEDVSRSVSVLACSVHASCIENTLKIARHAMCSTNGHCNTALTGSLSDVKTQWEEDALCIVSPCQWLENTL